MYDLCAGDHGARQGDHAFHGPAHGGGGVRAWPWWARPGTDRAAITPRPARRAAVAARAVVLWNAPPARSLRADGIAAPARAFRPALPAPADRSSRSPI